MPFLSRLGAARAFFAERSAADVLAERSAAAVPNRALLFTALSVFAIVAVSGCAPGNERFATEGPAGFWWGIWHGAISLITLVVGIWDPSVHVYEVRNGGGWYDFGFVLGVACAWGGGGRGGEHTWRRRRGGGVEAQRNRKEWEEVGRKVEAKMMRQMREWAEAEPNEAWPEVEKKIEHKARQVLKEWADDSSTPPSP